MNYIEYNTQVNACLIEAYYNESYYNESYYNESYYNESYYLSVNTLNIMVDWSIGLRAVSLIISTYIQVVLTYGILSYHTHLSLVSLSTYVRYQSVLVQSHLCIYSS